MSETLHSRYVVALNQYFGGDKEAGLSDAYEIGQIAYEAGLGGTELMRLHHEALAEASGNSAVPENWTLSAVAIGAELFAHWDRELLRLRAHQVEQRSLNDALRRQAQTLDQTNDALRAAKSDAEAATRAKAVFLANMSHEIRTPMNAVMGLTSLLLDTKLNAQQLDLAQTIRSSGEHLLTVINDILDFSKIDSGNLELEQVPFSIRTCIEEALDLVAVRAAQKNLDLAYMVQHRTPEGALGDSGRVRQVLLNLLSNAVKFTESGEVVVRLAARPVERGLHEFHVAVRDTGVGIPVDRIDRLFRAFSQLDVSTTRMYGGTGLGLAIVKSLATLMGGRAWAESQFGKGSTFHFTFLAEATVPPTQNLNLRPVPDLREKRVLIVDDSPTSRRILSFYAQAWGMHSTLVSAAAEAIDLLEAGETFDVALLDFRMPQMDGGELAMRIKKDLAPSLPIILVTSLGHPPTENTQFAAVLTKPIKPSHVFDALMGVFAPQSLLLSRRGGLIIERDLAVKFPLRILIAEDNAVNQKVAAAFLGKLGYQPDFVANGQEAVDAVVQRPYDVVFMDMQMPVMDGLQATREICRLFPADQRPRIIAMTANALPEDQKLCMEAGMDDYVIKPISLEGLARTLTVSGTLSASRVARTPPQEDFLAEPAADAPATADAAPAHAPAEPTVSVATLDNGALRQLRALGPEAFRELAGLYLVETPALIQSAQQAAACGDTVQLLAATHTLKSTSQLVGARALVSAVKALETDARAGRSDDLVTQSARLQPLFRAVAEALAQEKELAPDQPPG